MATATGQFTIIDYNDALTLTGYITSNLRKTQLMVTDNGTRTPDWTVSPYLILTPSLFKLGSGDDVITSAAVNSVTWYKITTSAGGTATETLISADSTHVFSGAKSHVLTIKSNDIGANDVGLDLVCVIVYTDPTINLPLTTKIPISFTKTVSGGGLTDAIGWAPHGNIFKNNINSTLTAQCTLWKSSVEDTTDVTYKWYKNQIGATGDADSGPGWIILSDVAGNVTGTATSTITIYKEFVQNVANFLCIITDTDTGSSTYNQKFRDTITFSDQTDPYQVVITSTAGNVFKNGQGSSVLSAKLYQSGEEIDVAGSIYTYTWTMTNKDGNTTNFISSPSGATRSGKSITVTHEDINVKGTFTVTVTA